MKFQTDGLIIKEQNIGEKIRENISKAEED